MEKIKGRLFSMHGKTRTKSIRSFFMIERLYFFGGGVKWIEKHK